MNAKHRTLLLAGPIILTTVYRRRAALHQRIAEAKARERTDQFHVVLGDTRTAERSHLVRITDDFVDLDTAKLVGRLHAIERPHDRVAVVDDRGRLVLRIKAPLWAWVAAVMRTPLDDIGLPNMDRLPYAAPRLIEITAEEADRLLSRVFGEEPRLVAGD